MRSLVLLSCLCLGISAFTPAASLCTPTQPQCRPRATVIKGAAPGVTIPPTWIADEDDLRRRRSVWALVFNFKSEKETIYAQQMGEDSQEYVITWQQREDAVRYGRMLADAHGYPGGTAVQVFTSWLLDTICKEATHTLCLIPSSTVVIPPDANVEDAPMEGLVSGGPMTEENLSRRRNELEALLEGVDTGDAKDQKDIFQYLNGELAKKTDEIVALEERVLKLEEEHDQSVREHEAWLLSQKDAADQDSP